MRSNVSFCSFILEKYENVSELDAFGKLPSSGIFEVPLIFDGSYQECQRISGKKYETNYCYLVLVPGRVGIFYFFFGFCLLCNSELILLYRRRWWLLA